MIATPAPTRVRLTPINLIAIVALLIALAVVVSAARGGMRLFAGTPTSAPAARPGPTGPTGPQGPAGARGERGDPGSAVAFATIDTASAARARVQPATPGRGVVEVTHPAVGTYCVRFALAAVESGTPVVANAAETEGVTVTTTWTGKNVICPAGMLEVVTFDTVAAQRADATFHLIVP